MNQDIKENLQKKVKMTSFSKEWLNKVVPVLPGKTKYHFRNLRDQVSL